MIYALKQAPRSLYDTEATLTLKVSPYMNNLYRLILLEYVFNMIFLHRNPV